jgi:hypothetical protein
MKLEQIPTLHGTRHTLARSADLANLCAEFENVVIGENEFTPTNAAEYLRSVASTHTTSAWKWRCAKETTTLHIW